MVIEWLSLAACSAGWLFFVVSCADLVCGFVHWLEDSYGSERTPIVGPTIIMPNRAHHARPREFLQNSWWRSARYQFIAGIGLIGTAVWAGWFSWQLMLFVIVAVNANEVHKWAHRSRAENGRLINWLQRRGLVQNQQQHARHHRGSRNSHYCTVTPWVNPVVDTLGVWRFLEFYIYRATGVRPVDERN